MISVQCVYTEEIQDDSSEQDSDTSGRATWDSKMQFLLSVIGYAVGLGNVWRFPYLCQQNGGGAFLIPYFIMMVIEGMPLLYMELAMGQRLQKGSIGVWREVHPMLGGLGYASAIMSFFVSLYYIAIIMWCAFYLCHSFTTDLPWASCPSSSGTHWNSTAAANSANLECEKSGPTSYFWYRKTLDISSGIDDIGGIRWELLVCLFAMWLLVFLCLCKGIKSQGKVVYFTATFPYIVLLVLCCRAVTLPGANVGIKHMFTPKMERLADAQVWLDAATQIFFSQGLAFGAIIAFSSYNSRYNNCKQDAIALTITNTLTSIFASIVVFAVLGFKATRMYARCLGSYDKFTGHEFQSMLNGTHHLTERIEVNGSHITADSLYNVRDCNLHQDLHRAAEGAGLSFIVFSKVMLELPCAPFWSVIFFLMLMAQGVGSLFGLVESVAASIVDIHPTRWTQRKEVTMGFICGVSCILGLLFVTRSGQYWVGLFDAFASPFPLIIIAFLEITGVTYLYGMRRFSADIEHMTGHPPHLFWRICWKVVAPLVLLIILVSAIVRKAMSPVTYMAYDKDTASLKAIPYPGWAGAVMISLIVIPLMCLPLVAIFRKFGILPYQPVEVATITLGSNTSSTARMLRCDTETDVMLGAVMNTTEDMKNIDDNNVIADVDQLDNGSLVVKFLTEDGSGEED